MHDTLIYSRQDEHIFDNGEGISYCQGHIIQIAYYDWQIFHEYPTWINV